MNKDVIYIEPDDDITDIITKIEKSKEKIVALVPPKKAGVFRSVVNIKLIAKSGASNDKTIVLVTNDPSIVRLAATVKLPVTKDLQSAPMIPTIDSEVDEDTKADLVEVAGDGSESEVKAQDVEEGESSAESEDDAGEDDDEDESDSDSSDDDSDKDDDNKDDSDDDSDKKSKKKSKSKKKADKKAKEGWFKSHKKRLVIGLIGILALSGLMVWALIFAPAVDITVWIQTDNNPFSEGVSFVNNLGDENAKEGKFFLEEKKIDTVQEIKFEATGKKNLGEKAKGVLTVSKEFSSSGGRVEIKPGDLFTHNGLSYAADNSVTLAYVHGDQSVCSNSVDVSGALPVSKQREIIENAPCLIYANVKITAVEAGSEYNLTATGSGWDTILNLDGISLNDPITGGTDKIINVVQQADVIKANEAMTKTNESENRKRLYEVTGDNYIILEPTFSQTTSEAVASPAVGEEVGEGVTPTLRATTITSMKVIDKTKVEEFITNKANLSSQQKIYEMQNPFIDNFTQTSSGYIGKLKTNYSVGPKVTNNEVLQMALGRGIGDLQHKLKDMPGIVSVETKTSYPWVLVVPDDPNKVSISIKIKGKDDVQIVDDSEESKPEENNGDDNTEDSSNEEKKEE